MKRENEAQGTSGRRHKRMLAPFADVCIIFGYDKTKKSGHFSVSGFFVS